MYSPVKTFGDSVGVVVFLLVFVDACEVCVTVMLTIKITMILNAHHLKKIYTPSDNMLRDGPGYAML